MFLVYFTRCPGFSVISRKFFFQYWKTHLFKILHRNLLQGDEDLILFAMSMVSKEFTKAFEPDNKLLKWSLGRYSFFHCFFWTPCNGEKRKIKISLCVDCCEMQYKQGKQKSNYRNIGFLVVKIHSAFSSTIFSLWARTGRPRGRSVHVIKWDPPEGKWRAEELRKWGDLWGLSPELWESLLYSLRSQRNAELCLCGSFSPLKYAVSAYQWCNSVR